MLKLLKEFAEAIFLGVTMESLLVEEEVWLHQTGSRAQMGNNFWFICWIVLKFLQEFSEIIFLGVPMQCLSIEEEVWSR